MMTGLIVALMLALAADAAGAEVSFDLAGRWRLDGTDERGAAISCEATVPGGVFGALLAAGKIPDPIVGDNEKRVQWVGRRPWTFRRAFRLESDFLRHRRVILRMDDVDTFADVCVNGQPVGATSNRFRRWDFDVKPLLKTGENEIVLRFASAEQKSEDLAKRLDRWYHISNVTVRHMNLIRKPACHGGWDWGPTVMETGPCGPVRLVASDGDRIDYVYHEQTFSDDLSRCTLAVFAELETGAVVTNRIVIERPPLWWPNGMGEQAFYDYDVPVCGRRLKGRVGLRKLEVSRKDGELAFVVNNRRLFARGANWIPSDVLASRETPARKRALLASAARANMNMVRVWGGGHFESDDFYAACDELGLLVWQDMMFACAVYPGWDDFLGEVRAEATHQVKRLRAHASVALWCGDNECIQIPHEHKKPEDRAFHFANLVRRVDVLREAISAADPTRLFWPGSPCQGEDDLSMPKFDDAKGDFHCWPPAEAGARVFAPHLRRRPRFASEFGFMSRSRCDAAGHCKSPRSEPGMRAEVAARFPAPKGRDEDVRFSQFAQAEALAAVTMAWRCDRPRCNGTLVWQLNDVWPVTGWSTIEYDGRWKPAHYALKRAFAPVAVARVGATVKVVNDGPVTVTDALVLRVRKLDGAVVAETTQTLAVAPGTTAEVPAPRCAADEFLEMRFGGVREVAVETAWKDLPLGDPDLAVTVEGRRVTLTAKRPAFHVWLVVPGGRGEFSDNDVTVLPGERVVLQADGDVADVRATSLCQATQLQDQVSQRPRTQRHGATGAVRTVDLVDLAQMDAALTLGEEFPGAKGRLAVAEADGAPVLRLSVDLEKGAYVGMNFREQIPEGSSRIRFAYRVASSAETCAVIFRFRDREGQYHLQRRSVTARGTWVESEFDLFAPANHWGNKVDDGVVRLPTEECTFAVELRGRSGRSGTLDLRGVRLVTTAGYDRLAPFVLKASSPRFGALYRPDETAEVDYRVFRRDGDVAVAGLRLKVEDWRGQELFRRAIPAGNGRERISADELGGRFGAFRAELSLPGQPAVKSGETWFARLTAKDDPKPCRWVGVGIHASHGWGGGDFRFLDLFSAAGIGLCRDEVSWGAVELKKGVYAMPENFERLVDGLHRRGIRFNNLLNSKNPVYANPLDPDAFAKYCAWHVRHLGDRCDLYEIWNEPHNFNFYQVYRDVYGYGRKPDGSLKDERGNVNLPWVPRFVELSRKAVGAIRAANPKADVAVCAEDSFPLLKKMLELGIATSNEIVTIHNYDHRNYPPEGDWFNRTDGRELREFASAHGGATRFATTEDGWTTYRGGPNGEYAFVGNYPPCTPEQQARYLVRMFVTGRQNGLEYISQYDFKDDGPRRNYTEHNFGIVHEDYTPKPSFAAISYMTRRIGASRPEGDVGPDHATCRIYRFRDADGRRTYVCWAIAGEVKVSLPAEMAGVAEMADLQGNVRPFAPTGEITLDENPVYLRYSDSEDFAARLDASFGIGSDRSLIGGNDLGLVNGHVTFNGRIEDVTRVAGVYAPPFVCADFSLSVSFVGRPVAAAGHFWRPEVLERTGETNAWKITSRLFPLHGKRGGLLRIEVENAAKTVRDIRVRLESAGTAGRCERWGFNKPVPTAGTSADGTAAKSVGWTLGDGDEGILKSVAPGERRTFSVAFAVGAPAEADGLVRTALAAPQKAADESVAAWRARVRKLADRMPRFETDDIALQRLYFRSLLHLLLAEWNVDAFVVKPYYATGGMNGGCICNYLWNFGGPFRLWPLLDREALKAHLRAFLNLDLESCYAFAPTDGAPLGPYYPINQEKIVFLIDAYVRETGDRAFLAERHKGRTMAEWAVRMSLTHDDLSRSAVLVDYGEGGKNHLELRKSYRYDGVLPDLNLRRIALLHIADRLCRIAGHDPKVDLAGRAAALRRLVREKLWDDEAGWFRAICSDGRPTLRYTMQMFKALGWGETVLDRDVEERLVKRLMDPKEFLGAYGVHSLSKLDLAYDENDVDNGGPGACPSFAPAICERLYRDGRFHEANDILMRLRWLGDSLPYWGDSQYADRRDYRRDTPLQCDIEGACLAQAIVFGLFGISIDDDFEVTFNPHLPDGVNRLSLKNLRLAGKTFDVRCSRKDGAAVVVRADIDR